MNGNINANFVIMMHGITATGKSIVANHLMRSIADTFVYHTAVIRKELNLSPELIGGDEGAYRFSLSDKVFVEKVSPVVYEEMVRRAEKEIINGSNIIFDGSYSMRWQREKVYNFAIRNNLPLYVIQCICSDEVEIKRRLSLRDHDRENPLSEAPDWDTYLSLRENLVPVEMDRLPSGERPKIIIYDSNEKKIKFLFLTENNKKEPGLKIILETLRGK